MLDQSSFQKDSVAVIEWIEHYLTNLKDFPVKSQVKPKEIYSQIDVRAPQEGTSLHNILKDTTDIILPGITHWQHPNFHAYFPANNSFESIFAEMITAAIGAQCMIWDTSPAAAELEQRMMEWLRDAMGLPSHWEGVIQDTASTATLVAILCAREKSTNYQSNDEGVPPGLRVYCSDQTHSSIEKGVVIAGIGRKNLIKIKSDDQHRLDPSLLKTQIERDIADGLTPCCLVAAIGTTGTVAIDDLEQIAQICKDFNIWLHVDAAYAGTALLLPEYQWMMKGGEAADSFVFNPHKWLFTNFDCTAYFVNDANHLIKTLEILPEYLKTKSRGKVNDYRDWGIPLGRRFRSLKLWFLFRSYGLNGIQERLRHHILLNSFFAKTIQQHPNIELIQEPFLTFTCFRFLPKKKDLPLSQINELNKTILEKLNESGQVFLSHTIAKTKYAIRVVISQTYVEKEDVQKLLNILISEADQL